VIGDTNDGEERFITREKKKSSDRDIPLGMGTATQGKESRYDYEYSEEKMELRTMSLKNGGGLENKQGKLRKTGQGRQF